METYSCPLGDICPIQKENVRLNAYLTEKAESSEDQPGTLDDPTVFVVPQAPSAFQREYGCTVIEGVHNQGEELMKDNDSGAGNFSRNKPSCLILSIKQDFAKNKWN